jgi:hypothetical protein
MVNKNKDSSMMSKVYIVAITDLIDDALFNYCSMRLMIEVGGTFDTSHLPLEHVTCKYFAKPGQKS